MNKPLISIIMPAIRQYNWDRAYNSILTSTNKNFELIIISPYPLTPYLQNKTNVKYVKDYGSPTRATCIGGLICEGKFIFPTMADDAVFIQDAIDKNLDFLISMGECSRNVVVCKYSESQNFTHKERYQNDDYYKLVNSYPVNHSIISKDWWIFNTVFMYRSYFEQLGGYDSTFEAACMAHADLAIRAQYQGAIVKMSEFPILQCDHIPNGGDHVPIEIAQIHYDTPKFIAKYIENIPSAFVYTENWKEAETVWSKRFK